VNQQLVYSLNKNEWLNKFLTQPFFSKEISKTNKNKETIYFYTDLSFLIESIIWQYEKGTVIKKMVNYWNNPISRLFFLNNAAKDTKVADLERDICKGLIEDKRVNKDIVNELIINLVQLIKKDNFNQTIKKLANNFSIERSDSESKIKQKINDYAHSIKFNFRKKNTGNIKYVKDLEMWKENKINEFVEISVYLVNKSNKQKLTNQQ
ncbi:MAG: hypothetical protein Q7S92_03025, partial [Candidatus Diapherotrites archaeon]|nr:hypothetical protein [Candidatus Diapherotrites archaeon]